MTLTFEEWKKQLQAEFTKNDWPEDYVEQVDDSSWREMFNDDLTPQEAASEEMSCGEPI